MTHENIYYLLSLVYTCEYIYIMHMFIESPYFSYYVAYKAGFGYPFGFWVSAGLVLGTDYRPNRCSVRFRVSISGFGFGCTKTPPDSNLPRCHPYAPLGFLHSRCHPPLLCRLGMLRRYPLRLRRTGRTSTESAGDRWQGRGSSKGVCGQGEGGGQPPAPLQHVQHLIYFWNIQMKHLQHTSEQIKHSKHVSKTLEKSMQSIYNIQIKIVITYVWNICTIQKKHLQTYVWKTDEIFGTYICKKRV
jgi:hypothetical protein